jgi:hypothetical protein
VRHLRLVLSAVALSLSNSVVASPTAWFDLLAGHVSSQIDAGHVSRHAPRTRLVALQPYLEPIGPSALRTTGQPLVPTTIKYLLAAAGDGFNTWREMKRSLLLGTPTLDRDQLLQRVLWRPRR